MNSITYYRFCPITFRSGAYYAYAIGQFATLALAERAIDEHLAH